MRRGRLVAGALCAVLAGGVLAGCAAAGPDPDRAQWEEWIDATEPVGSSGGGAGLVTETDGPARVILALKETPLTLDSIQLGCTGSGTMSFAVTLTPVSGAKTTFSHDIVCSDRMATPISHPADVDTVTRVVVAVTSDDGRGAWRVTLNPAN
jgi:hypothetical protein